MHAQCIPTPPLERWWRNIFGRDLMESAQIHNLSTQHLKPLRRQRFSEEVSIVVICAHERHHDLLSFYHIANEEMSSRDVF